MDAFELGLGGFAEGDVDGRTADGFEGAAGAELGGFEAPRALGVKAGRGVLGEAGMGQDRQARVGGRLGAHWGCSAVLDPALVRVLPARWSTAEGRSPPMGIVPLAAMDPAARFLDSSVG